VIFVDIMMPRLDGYQTCALIKQNPHLNPRPVIMLSSKDGVFDRGARQARRIRSLPDQALYQGRADRGGQRVRQACFGSHLIH